MGAGSGHRQGALVLARELRGKDITVNAVGPGPTATPLFLDGKDEAAIANLSKAAPLERLIENGSMPSAMRGSRRLTRPRCPKTSPRWLPSSPAQPVGSTVR